MSRLQSSGVITRFNPWWGCVRVSPACKHCYAEKLAHRYGHEVWGKNSDRRMFGDKHWNEPLKWDRKAAEDGVRRRVFCASMADVFDGRPDLDEQRERLWDLIAGTPNLDWLLLTKRPENVLQMVPRRWLIEPGNLLCESCRGSASLPLEMRCNEHEPRMTGWPANAWIGTTVEDRRYAARRLPDLYEIPAPVRFLSCEPLLDSVAHLIDYEQVDWVIAGGESGPGSRPTSPASFRWLRDRCVESGTPFLFKQWGDWGPTSVKAIPSDPSTCAVHPAGMVALTKDNLFDPFAAGHPDWSQMRRVGKKNAGRELDGRTWTEFPTLRSRQ